jgi:hypothetical protein
MPAEGNGRYVGQSLLRREDEYLLRGHGLFLGATRSISALS